MAGLAIAAARVGALRHVEALAVGAEQDAGRAELAAVQPRVGAARPSPRRRPGARARSGLAVVGHVQRAVGTPGAVVGAGVSLSARTAGRRSRRCAKAPVSRFRSRARAGVRSSTTRSPSGVARGDLHAVVAVTSWPGTRPRAQQLPVAAELEDARGHGVAAAGSRRCPRRPARRVHVAQRGIAGRGNAGEQLRVEAGARRRRRPRPAARTPPAARHGQAPTREAARLTALPQHLAGRPLARAHGAVHVAVPVGRGLGAGPVDAADAACAAPGRRRSACPGGGCRPGIRATTARSSRSRRSPRAAAPASRRTSRTGRAPPAARRRRSACGARGRRRRR